MDCIAWGREESDMTEQLSFSLRYFLLYCLFFPFTSSHLVLSPGIYQYNNLLNGIYYVWKISETLNYNSPVLREFNSLLAANWNQSVIETVQDWALHFLRLQIPDFGLSLDFHYSDGVALEVSQLKTYVQGLYSPLSILNSRFHLILFPTLLPLQFWTLSEALRHYFSAQEFLPRKNVMGKCHFHVFPSLLSSVATLDDHRCCHTSNFLLSRFYSWS